MQGDPPLGVNAFEEPARPNALPFDMVEDVLDEVAESLSELIVHDQLFARQDRQDVVVLVAVLELLHQPLGPAVDDIARMKQLLM